MPDEITDAMVADRLVEPDCADGFLLDGYPRTLTQVKQLETLLIAQDVGLDAVLLLTVENDELTRRLLRRAGQEGRTDDTEPVIRRRLQVYLEQTAPLALEYDALGLLAEVNATGPIDHVTDRILTALDRHRRQRPHRNNG